MNLKSRWWMAALLAALPAMATAAPTAPFALSVSILPPASSFDFSDLDARDAFNRPIAHPEVRASLERLFVSSVLESMLNNRTPLHQTTARLLQRSWHGSLWWGALLAGWRAAMAVAMPQRWRSAAASRARDSRPQPDLPNGAGPRHASFVFLISRLLSSTCLQR